MIGLVGSVCPFCLALWKKESFSLLVPDGAYLGPDEVIPDELYVCSERPKGLKSGKDTWREAPHRMAIRYIVINKFCNKYR